MLPQRLDITLAFKALSLSGVLTSTEKQVAAAIIDSFNFRTLQCDPSFDRIAHLVGKSRRTIIRAVKRLERMGFLNRVRHGGHFHRNLYRPNWARFRKLEASWKARKATRHWGSDVALSVVSGSSHIVGDELGTQTIPINQSSETSPSPQSGSELHTLNSSKENSSKQEFSVSRNSAPPLHRDRPSQASIANSALPARLSAERRWNSVLLKRLVDQPELYAQAIEAIDPELQQKATEAELERKGGGLSHIIKVLASRGLRL